MSNPAKDIGGKAEGLRLLQDAGCRVPAFVSLPASAFAPHLLDDYSLKPGWQESEAFAEVRHVLAKAQLSSPEARQLFAVRSSALGEDGLQYAHPGMLDTQLGVAAHDVPAAIEAVVRSANNDRVLAYRREMGLDACLLPAVIVQEWIDAEYSGVLFSTYPVYPNELLIHTVQGAGEALVQGQSDPVETAFDKPSGEVYWQEIPEDEQALSAELLQELFETATRLETKLGYPIDLEFCVANGTIYWLQMRAITTPPAAQIVLDNANIQESYCGLTSELSFTFAERAYATVYRQTMRALGLSEAKVAAQEEIVQHLLRRYRGRVYYNINNWYRGLALLPAFRQNKSDLERMMGLESPVSFVEDRQKSVWQMITGLPTLGVNLVRLLLAFRRLPKTAARFEIDFEKVFDQFYAAEPAHFTEADCQRWYQRLDVDVLERWEVPIINDFYVMMQNGKAHRKLEKIKVAEPDTWLQEHLRQDKALPSLEPMLGLQSLATLARKDAELMALLREDSPTLFRTLAAQHPSFAAEVQAYIHRYGDRVMGELKMETVTMRVDPNVLLRYLRPMLDVAPTHAAPESSPTPKWLRPLRDGIFRREALRLQRTRLFGMYRSLYRRMGELLQTSGAIASPNDIFHWRLEELEHYWQTGATVAQEEIDRRIQESNAWLAEEPPGRVYVPGRNLQPLITASADGKHWRGQAAVAGEAEGEVVCITGPEDYVPLKGKILCALRTDPGWAPLFPGCKGVIIERGSSLSHSVIVLRELGIPAIINLPGITRTLATGDRVRIDGQTGQLTRV